MDLLDPYPIPFGFELQFVTLQNLLVFHKVINFFISYLLFLANILDFILIKSMYLIILIGYLILFLCFTYDKGTLEFEIDH